MAMSGPSEKADAISSTAPVDGDVQVHSSNELPNPGKQNVHYVTRNEDGSLPTDDKGHIPGYNATLMQARATLSSDEEKKLLRRIDWHLLPLLAVMYMVKTIDSNNVGGKSINTVEVIDHFKVSNARVMDKDTPYNIMTELKMTSNQYNLVTTMYYVGISSKF